MIFDYELRPDQVALCAHAGCQRHIENMIRKRQDAHGCTTEGWTENVNGCIGEYVMCRHLRQPWDGKGVFRGPDVGVRDQARLTRYANGHLLVHREPDKPTDRFWLVTGEEFIFRVHGWAWGHEAKRDEWWGDKAKNGRPAFWVPQRVLHPASGDDWAMVVEEMLA